MYSREDKAGICDHAAQLYEPVREYLQTHTVNDGTIPTLAVLRRMLLRAMEAERESGYSNDARNRKISKDVVAFFDSEYY